MLKGFLRCSRPGSVLLLTLVMLMLLALQVAMISLITVRGFGEEGMLLTQNTTAREAGNTAVSRLQEALQLYLQTSDAASAETAFARGGTNDIDSEILMADNPDGGGSEAMPVTISAWVQERRGNMYHLVGRAVVGGVDMVTHRWVYVKPCVSSTNLLTLATGQTGPGFWYAVGISPTGEVFWGDHVLSTGKFYSWSEANGLSVIKSNVGYAGANDFFINQYQKPSSIAFFNNGRVVFGQIPGAYSSYWTYKNGLLTVLGSGYNPVDASVVNSTGTEVYFTSKDNKGVRYNETTGQSTLITVPGPDYCNPGEAASLGIDGTDRVYWGCSSATKAWTWASSTGLSTIGLTLTAAPGTMGSMVGSPVEARVFFGGLNSGTPRSFYTWTPGSGLVALMTTTDGGLGRFGTVVASDGRVFWTSLLSGVGGRVWSWKNGVGLTTIFAGVASENQYYELEIVRGGSEDGRLYAMEDNTTTSRMRTWSAADGVSVIRTNLDANGSKPNNLSDVAPDGRVYFGENNNTASATRGMWTWAKSTGLSLILGNRKRTGAGCVRAVPATNGVVFCDRDTAASDNNVYYWDPSSKSLITLLTGPGQPGYHSMAVSKDGTSVAIGNASTGNIYLWKQGERKCDP